jgi:hypothetical protein
MADPSQAVAYDRVRAHGSKKINARMDRLREENVDRAALLELESAGSPTSAA